MTRHRYRVSYEDGSVRFVWAFSTEGALVRAHALDLDQDPDAPEPADAERVHSSRRPERVVVRREV